MGKTQQMSTCVWVVYVHTLWIRVCVFSEVSRFLDCFGGAFHDFWGGTYKRTNKNMFFGVFH